MRANRMLGYVKGPCHHIICREKGFPSGSAVKNIPAIQETWVWSLDWENPPEKEMATHSSILAWKIPWTEEPGGLQPTGSKSCLATKQQQQSVLLIHVFSPCLVLLCVFLFVCWAFCFFVCFFPVLYHILSPSFSISPQSLCSTSFPCLKQAKDSRLQYL